MSFSNNSCMVREGSGFEVPVFHAYVAPALCFTCFLLNVLVLETLMDSSCKKGKTAYRAGDHQFQTPTYTYFKFLTAFQAGELAVMGIRPVFEQLLSQHHRVASFIEAYFFWPAFSYCSTMSLALTVALAINRLFVLRKKPHESCRREKRERKVEMATTVSLTICTAGLVLNLPRMFALSVDSVTGCLVSRWGRDPMRGISWFAVYSMSRLVAFNLCSVAILSLLNLNFIVRLCWPFIRRCLCSEKNAGVKGIMGVIGSATPLALLRQRERTLTICLVVVFVLCSINEIAAIGLNPIVLPMIIGKKPVNFDLKALGTASFLLGDGCSFFIFILLNSSFRNRLAEKFSCKKLQSRRATAIGNISSSPLHQRRCARFLSVTISEDNANNV